MIEEPPADPANHDYRICGGTGLEEWTHKELDGNVYRFGAPCSDCEGGFMPEPTAEEITEHAHNGEIWEPIMRRWLRAKDVAEQHDRDGWRW